MDIAAGPARRLGACALTAARSLRCRGSVHRENRRWSTPPAERGELVAHRCADDPALRAEVEALLQVWDEARRDTIGADAENPPLPRDAGRFRLLRVLGEGGMGTVYLTRELASGRELALKMLKPALLATPLALERFRVEARLAASVTHPHCIFVYGLEVVEGIPAMALELLPGGSLDDHVRAADPPSVARAVEWIHQVVDGLEAAQQAGILHRDVKPSNCLLDAGGRVKVADFGLSRLSTQESHLTATGDFVGTPLYCSPEQAKGAEIDFRSDIYAVGATLYALLAGPPAFLAGSSGAVLAQVLEQEPTPLREMRPDVPEAIELVVRRAMAKDPDRRFQCYEDLRRALHDALPAETRPPSPVVRVYTFLFEMTLVLWTAGLLMPRAFPRLGWTPIDVGSLRGFPSFGFRYNGAVERMRRRPLLVLSLAGLVVLVAAGLFLRLGGPPPDTLENTWSERRSPGPGPVAAAPASMRTPASAEPSRSAETAAAPTNDEDRPIGETGSVTGRVVHADGRPAAAATVVATAVDVALGPRTATTADDGSYRLDLPRHVRAASRPRRVRWWLYATRPGLVSRAGESVVLERPGTLHVAPLVLLPEARLAGRVIDAEGHPIEGARIFCEVSNQEIATSAADGSFDAPQTWLGVEETAPTASKDDHVLRRGPPPRWLEPGDRWDGIELVLDSFVPLEGRVVDTRGTPVAGVDVRSFRREARLLHNRRNDFNRATGSAETDAAGSFELDVPRDGRFSLQASSGWHFSPPIDFVERPDDPPVLTFEPRPRTGRPVILLVSDVETHGPITGRIGVRVRRTEHWIQDLSGRDVEHAVDGLMSGARRIHVEPSETQTIIVRSPGFLEGESEPFSFEGDAPPTVQVALQRGGVLEGTIRSTITGEPVPFAFVAALSRKELGRGHSDAEGRYLLDELPDATVRFRVVHPEHAPFTSRPLAVGPRRSPTRLDVTLVEGGTVRSRVTTRGGAPVPGVEVEVRRDGIFFRETTDAAGEVFLGPLNPGPWRLEVSRGGPELPRAGHPALTVDVRAGEETSHDIVVEDLGGAVLTGAVTRDGRAAPHCELALFDVRGDDAAYARTTRDGGFVFTPVLPGRYRLEVLRPGNRHVLHRAVVDVPLEPRPLAIDLREATLTVQLERRPGAVEPVLAGVGLRIFVADPALRDDPDDASPWHEDFEALLVREGERRTITGLPPGRYRLTADVWYGVGDVVSGVTLVDLRPGEHVTERLRLVPPASLVVRVPPALPEDEFMLVLEASDGEAVFTEYVKGGSEESLTDLGPGSYRLLLVRHDEDGEIEGARPEREWPVTLVGGQRLEFDLPEWR